MADDPGRDPASASARRPSRSGSRRSSSRRGMDELLLLQAPAPTQDWVSDRFGRILERCARQILGSAARVAFDGPKESATRAATRAAGPPQADAGATFNPRYSFDQFIIGEGNRLAHAGGAGRRRASRPGLQPAVPARPSGYGKTHLLHAIGNYVRAFGGGATVRYTTAEAFTNHFIAALGAKVTGTLQARLPQHRRAADRRRPVPGQQGQDRGGVLSHLQRALRERPPARADLRSPPARAGRRSRTGCASASRPDSSPTSAPGPRDPSGDPAQARRNSTRSRSPSPRVLELIAERVDRQRPSPGGRADPRRRPPLADPASDRPRARDRGDGRHVSRPAAPAPTVDRGHPGDRRRPLRHQRRRAHLAQPRGPGRLAAPDRDPPRPRAHHRLPAGHRRAPSGGATTPPCCTPASACPSACATINKLSMKSPSSSQRLRARTADRDC